MFKNKLSEEVRSGLILAISLLLLPLVMILINKLLGGGKEDAFIEKQKEKTVIITQPKQSVAPQAPLSGAIVSTVRDAIKKGNYSTARMEIRNVSKTSPEYEELNKILAEETRKQKAPGLRKDTGASTAAPIRYLDESTPRDRSTDAIFIYFVDISGTFLPRFCIQAAAKHPLRITGFTITADNKSMEMHAHSVQSENIKKGVAEWYDVPLDRRTYEIVQAMIKAKKVTLTITGGSGRATRTVTDTEKQGFRQILDGYAALGGNLNFLQDSKPAPSVSAAKRPSAHR
ncbi:MAG TPA: hypothetical protein VN642_08325 [Dongiaceae bacterium]|nr:hypothetical protein [Dongiaceae bacterium]